MAGDVHGIDNEEEVAAPAGGQEGVVQKEGAAVAGNAPNYQTILSKQEGRIKELESQVAEAAKTAEAADALRGEIEQVKAQLPTNASNTSFALRACAT